jgi:uncharacterized protein YegL
MEMKKVLLSFIQDRSGSMETVWAETLSGFKTYVKNMQADQEKDNEVEYVFSLTTFDTQIETPCIGKPIADVDQDLLKHHGPRGGTALYDAVGQTLRRHDEDKTLTFDKAIVIIVTDGQENSSREWSKEAVHAAIDERIKRGNWTFTYLGTQPETWDDAQSLGVGVGASATYSPQNVQATYATMAAASTNMARGASGQSMSFLHDNTTPMMRCAVGMKTATDNDGLDSVAGVGTTAGVSSPLPAPPAPAPPARPRTAPPKVRTDRRWK